MTDNWRDDALCAQIGGEEFFPEKGGITRYAKKICGACPVSTQCLDSVMALPAAEDYFGVFGGLSVQERRVLRKAAA